MMVSMNRPEGVRLRSAATGARGGGAGGGLLQCAGGRRELLCGYGTCLVTHSFNANTSFYTLIIIVYSINVRLNILSILGTVLIFVASQF